MRFRLESLSFRKLLYISTFQYISSSPKQPVVHGDVNGDDIVNGTDIQAIINAIVDDEYDENADVNHDGTVNGTDIQEVINIIVNADWPP